MKLVRFLSLAAATLACTAARAYQIFFCYDEFGLPTDGAGFLSLVPAACFALFALLAFRVKDWIFSSSTCVGLRYGYT